MTLYKPMYLPSHFPLTMWSHFGSASAIARSTADARAKNAEKMFRSYSGFGRRELRRFLDRRLKWLLWFGKYKGLGSIPKQPRSPRFLSFKKSPKQGKTIWQLSEVKICYDCVNALGRVTVWSRDKFGSFLEKLGCVVGEVRTSR